MSYVLLCLTCLVPYLLLCSTCLVSYICLFVISFCTSMISPTESANLRALRAFVPYVPRAPCALVSHVLSCPTCSGALCALYPTCSRASYPTWSCVSRSLCFTCLVLYAASCLVLCEPFFLTYPIVSYLRLLLVIF